MIHKTAFFVNMRNLREIFSLPCTKRIWKENGKMMVGIGKHHKTVAEEGDWIVKCEDGTFEAIKEGRLFDAARKAEILVLNKEVFEESYKKIPCAFPRAEIAKAVRENIISQLKFSKDIDYDIQVNVSNVDNTLFNFRVDQLFFVTGGGLYSILVSFLGSEGKCGK